MDELITINQLTECLQVDRLTVYRMLKDGRIRGVKVGRQWRVPRSEVADMVTGERQLEHAEELRPSDVLPVHCLQVIQDVFAEMVMVGSLTTDKEGEPLTEISNSCNFCDLIHSSPSGRAACVASWRKVVSMPKSGPEFISCHAGLQYARACIEQGGQVIGAQIAGQFYFERPERKEEEQRVAALAAEHDLDEETLLGAARRIRVLDSHDRPRISRWLERVADTYEIIALERADLIGRLESIATLSSFGD
jgi:excisionase family DNA binding protein